MRGRATALRSIAPWARSRRRTPPVTWPRLLLPSVARRGGYGSGSAPVLDGLWRFRIVEVVVRYIEAGVRNRAESKRNPVGAPPRDRHAYARHGPRDAGRNPFAGSGPARRRRCCGDRTQRERRWRSLGRGRLWRPARRRGGHRHRRGRTRRRPARWRGTGCPTIGGGAVAGLRRGSGGALAGLRRTGAACARRQAGSLAARVAPHCRSPPPRGARSWVWSNPSGGARSWVSSNPLGAPVLAVVAVLPRRCVQAPSGNRRGPVTAEAVAMGRSERSERDSLPPSGGAPSRLPGHRRPSPAPRRNACRKSLCGSDPLGLAPPASALRCAARPGGHAS